MPDSSPRTIALVHGLWMTPMSWEHWVARYEAAGHTVHALTWPGTEKIGEEIRRDPSAIAKLTGRKVLDHLVAQVTALPGKPIIMGHSFGGAFTQLLIDRGLGTAGVAINSGHARGVFRLPLSTLKAARPVLRNPLNRGKAIGLTPKQFYYAFGNALSREESDAAHAKYHIPAPATVLFEGAMVNLNPRTTFKVDFKKPNRAPLLFITGGSDHIVPPSLNHENARRYKTGVVEVKDFPGRSHITVGQPGWEAVADYALDWAISKTPAS